MGKISSVFVLLIILLFCFSIGCAKEEQGRKLVSSRPIQAEPRGGSGQTGSDSVATAQQTVEQPSEPETYKVPTQQSSAGTAQCEQLTLTDLSTVMGGTWSKTSDCPQRPMMPKGVDVCRCDYDGPKQVYVNVETQLYDDSDEAERVYNMYCKGTAEESEVGKYSCRVERTDSMRPNFVYFLKGNYFVKVSCLGGSCPLDTVADLAKKVDARI